MELEIGGAVSVQPQVETVEVVTGGEEQGREGFMEPHIIVTHPQQLMDSPGEVQIETQTLASVPPLEMVGHNLSSIPIQVPPGTITLSMDPSSPIPTTQTVFVGTKRSYPESNDTDSVAVSSYTSAGSQELPRKKSRNYLDSHKNIEKKRRDRINLCLNALKSLVPDCRQYGSKKLDKAEILEMTIEFIQRMQLQVQNLGRGSGGLETLMSQRDWSSDLTTWVLQNKVLYSGPNALDQFCQALLLHLQTFGSQTTLSAANLLLNQAAVPSSSPSTEEDLKHQAAQTTLLHQLSQTQQPSPKAVPAISSNSEPLPLSLPPPPLLTAASTHQQLPPQPSSSAVPSSSSPASQPSQGQQQQQQQQQLAQAQLAQLQAILLLQQQQQILSQQQQETSNSDGAQQLQVQLQQIQQLQALLIQHIANECSSNQPTTPQHQQQQASGVSCTVPPLGRPPTPPSNSTNSPALGAITADLSSSSSSSSQEQPITTVSSSVDSQHVVSDECFKQQAQSVMLQHLQMSHSDTLSQAANVASSVLTPTNVSSSDVAHTMHLSLTHPHHHHHPGGVGVEVGVTVDGEDMDGPGGISSEETVYSSGLGDNLLQMNVTSQVVPDHAEVVSTDVITDPSGVPLGVPASEHMWSTADTHHTHQAHHLPTPRGHNMHAHSSHPHPLLLIGAGEEGEGGEQKPPQVLVGGAEDVQEEVELLTNQEQ